jgi:hypothetical protein
LIAPDFRFAHVGWDAYKTTSEWLFESVDSTGNGELTLDLSCVVNDRLYNEPGSPISLRKFHDGYKWRWYKGETYSPLFSSDQKELQEISEKLLPYNLEPNSVWW